MTDYAELRAAVEAATPGPWTQGESAAGLSCVWVGGKSESVGYMGPECSWIDCNTEPNARYIAACHPEAIRSMLAERDALQDVLIALEGLAEYDGALALARAALAQGEV